VRSYVVTLRAPVIGTLAGIAVIVLLRRQRALTKRQSAASLTISWFHNDGLGRHVSSVGEVKSFLFADRNKKRRAGIASVAV
jgi:hypothetical protein